jgi:hypothetical protein
VLFTVVDARERRHVVRALRDRRDVAQPRLPAVELGLLHADLGRRADLVGSFGLFFTLFLLFCRWLPMVAIAEAALPLQGPAGSEKDEHHG